MSAEQIGVLVLFALIALVNYVAQVLRRRPQAPKTTWDSVEAPPPPGPSPRPPVSRPQMAAPRATPRRGVPVASRSEDERQRVGARRRARPRFSARDLRGAVVLAVVLAPPGGLYPSDR
jgi:hypothetical protein